MIQTGSIAPIQLDGAVQPKMDPANSAVRQWVRQCPARRTQVAPERDVLGEAQCHADRSGTESVVKPGAGLQQAGDQWADEGNEIDTEIKQGETTVAARIALPIKGAQ